MNVPLPILVLGMAIVLAAGCARRPSAAPGLPPCCRNPLPVAHPTDRSVYQLDSVWTSDTGKRVQLGVLHGRPQVVAMFFTRCEYACPVLVHDLKRIEEALPVGVRDRVDFLLVSFDSGRDTPVTLREYREHQGLGMRHWTLLTGNPDDVRELAALLGVNFQRDARGQFAHSNVITLLDAEGQIGPQLRGLNGPVDEAVATLSRWVGH